VSDTVTVIIGHHLGKVEAVRRLKEGFARSNGHLGPMIAMEQETWEEDILRFRIRALGQTAAASIEVLDDALRIDSPWWLPHQTSPPIALVAVARPLDPAASRTRSNDNGLRCLGADVAALLTVEVKRLAAIALKCPLGVGVLVIKRRFAPNASSKQCVNRREQTQMFDDQENDCARYDCCRQRRLR
jgi:hypothetical protein